MNAVARSLFGGIRSAAVSYFALAWLFALALLSPRPALADLGDDIPKAGYYAAVNELYTGDYHHAERDFRSLVRGAIKTVNARWIDSICYQHSTSSTPPRKCYWPIPTGCCVWCLTIPAPMPLRLVSSRPGA